MSQFVLAREAKGEKGKHVLPGIPIALVQSETPSLAGTFLCAVESTIDRAQPRDELATAALLQAARKTRKFMKNFPRKDQSTLTALKKGEQLTGGRSLSASFFSKHPEEVKDRVRSIQKGRKEAYYDNDEREQFLSESETEEDDSDEEDEPDAPAATGRSKDFSTPQNEIVMAETGFIELPPYSKFDPLPLVKIDDLEGKGGAYRTTMYIAGRAGSGKSVWAAGVVRRFHKIWPDRPIFGICKTKFANDPAYEHIPIRQITLPKLREFAKNQAERLKRGGASMTSDSGETLDVAEAFGNTGCLVIFDDWDSFEKKDKEFVLAVMKDVENLGRKMNISIIVTSHLLTNYNETRGIIAEAEFVVVFPNHTMFQQLAYFCGKLGLPKDLIETLTSRGRWVMVHNQHPLFVLSEDKCEFLVPSMSMVPEGRNEKKRIRARRAEREEPEEEEEEEVEPPPPSKYMQKKAAMSGGLLTPYDKYARPGRKRARS